MTDPSQVGKAVPIGRPISNTWVYVLNEAMQPVADGVPGELYIGGDGLARGYLNQPALTAERFVPCPFGLESGGRLYRSGDLVRHLPDGNLEFLGRLDHQVKVRGFRVEPGEIESVLTEHPLVRSAVVHLHEVLHEDKRLVAYLVAEPQAGDIVAVCRTFLRARLPDYMVPSAFVSLEALPLTPEGKLDRAALPAPDPAPAAVETAYAAPETPLQRQLATIWEDLLGVRRIGIRDDFFDLGGHSLLAVKLLSAVEHVMGTHLPLTSLLSEPTIEHMAATLAWEERAERYSTLTPIQAGISRHPLFFVHGDRLHSGVYCVRLARLLGPEQPFYALHNGPDVPNTVQAMAAEHIETIRAIQLEGPYLLGGYCAGGVVAFEMANQLRKTGQAVARVAMIEAQRHDVLYPRLHHLMSSAAALVGFSMSRRQDLSMRLRFRASRWHYYAAKLRHLSRRSAREQLNWLLRQARRAFGRRMIRRAAGSAGEDYTGSIDSREWRRAVLSLMRYNPGRYPGRVDLFWGGGEDGTHIDGHVTDWQTATRYWRAVAGDVRVHVIPGTHGSLISTRIADLAEQLKACIEDPASP
jgi:thioesterase domain-containing protein